ncbi:MAG TPA: EF-hand domain-containing protein [Tenuifilaceae bacterium]|nr:EF-hand domain-containing protein [Tenuifilaceae bacterium]
MKTPYFSFLFFLIALNTSAQNYLNQYSSSYYSAPQFVYNNNIREHIGDSISERTLKIFRNADSNGDGKISVGELQSFQNWLKRSFKYKQNSTALHPDDFIDQGGGDCEDFSIMTTCMLNYHGVVAYVAGFGRVTVNKHAVCIAQVTSDKVSGYLYYTLSGWGIPSGIYIPIDYEKVGGLSAIDRRWKIARINKPVSIYGVYM